MTARVCLQFQGLQILFLDVLFPLNVRKIIFVDADQVVRTDLMDLMNLDLGGAPTVSRHSATAERRWKAFAFGNKLLGVAFGRRQHRSGAKRRKFFRVFRLAAVITFRRCTSSILSNFVRLRPAIASAANIKVSAAIRTAFSNLDQGKRAAYTHKHWSKERTRLHFRFAK